MPGIEEMRAWLRGDSKNQQDPVESTVRWKSCGECGGVGSHDKGFCHQCDGIGFIPKTSRLVDKMESAGKSRATPRKGGKYRINMQGNDAILLFGKWKDRLVSDVDTDYLVWMVLQGGFPEDLIDVALIHLRPDIGKLRFKEARSIADALGVGKESEDGDASAEQLIRRLKISIDRRLRSKGWR